MSESERKSCGARSITGVVPASDGRGGPIGGDGRGPVRGQARQPLSPEEARKELERASGPVGAITRRPLSTFNPTNIKSSVMPGSRS